MATREERLEYVRQLLREHPKWGEPRINKMLKAEYGQGLRKIDVANLKRELVWAEGRFTRESIAAGTEGRIATMGFIEAQQIMFAAGFVMSEVREFFSAHGVVDALNSEPFRAMLRTRLKLVRGMRAQGLTRSQIYAELTMLHKSSKDRSVFEWLRREYRPPRAIDRKKYREAARERAKARTSATIKVASRRRRR